MTDQQALALAEGVADAVVTDHADCYGYGDLLRAAIVRHVRAALERLTSRVADQHADGKRLEEIEADLDKYGTGCVAQHARWLLTLVADLRQMLADALEGTGEAERTKAAVRAERERIAADIKARSDKFSEDARLVGGSTSSRFGAIADAFHIYADKLRSDP